MSYLPHTEAEIEEMLRVIGVKQLEDLFPDVPTKVRFPELNLPAGLTQMETAAIMEEIAEANIPGSKTAMFLGAGAYSHYSPPVVNHTILRGEFLTAYTPYQPEVSQGTLQAVFEYQSMICALTGMDVANASHYDGATSLAEATILALNVNTKRKKVVLSLGVNPQYREVVRTYTQGMGLSIIGDEESHSDLSKLIGLLDENTAMVAVGYPNFFGQIEDIGAVVSAAHKLGILVAVVTDPTALGLLKPPGWLGADIVVGEGQSLGVPLSFGGPYLGFFATRDEYVRKMAGRLVGETLDVNGNPGYVLTLATREQHIRRSRATSNICTNQGLMALVATVYMAAMGKHGLRKVAELCWHKAHYAAEEIAKLPAYRIDNSKPFFLEFVVTCPASVSEINEFLLDEYGIIGGYDLSLAYPDRENQMLVAVTEMNTRDQIDMLVEGLEEVAE